MRNFQMIAEDLDMGPLQLALARRPDLWDAHPMRTRYPGTPHAEASDILLFFNDLERPIEAIDELDVKPYPAWTQLPQARPLVNFVMTRVEGVRLGRTMITRLAPGMRITPHEDAGEPARYYDRYQAMISCRPGVIFRCGEENLMAKTGDVFLFNNQLVHEVVNNSDADRVVMILDVRSA